MSTINRALVALNIGVPGVVWGLGMAHPADAAKVTIPGSYHTTKKTGNFVDYNKAKSSVVVDYTVTTKIDTTTGKKVFDTSDTNSYVTLTNEFGGGFTTVKIPITSVDGDPATGDVKSFKFSGTEWDPRRLSTGKTPALNDGVSGEVNVVTKTSTIMSKYKDKAGNQGHYTFASQNEPPGKAKAAPKGGNPIISDSTISPGQSIDYNANSGLLTISGDTIVGTPDPTDPILNANMNVSQYQFTGITTDGSLGIFWATDDFGPMSITNGGGTLEQADLPVLFYDMANNEFYGSPLDFTLAGMSASSPFYDPGLSAVSSPFFNTLEDVLDPSSSDFDPNANLFLTITPDVNLGVVTDDFTIPGGSGASDALLVADAVPEPSSLGIFLAGLAGLFRLGRSRQGRRPHRGVSSPPAGSPPRHI